MRNRQIHNIWGLYAGRSPATGYHYFDYNDLPHNNSNLTVFDSNGLRQVDRIQNFSYGFDIDRTNLSQLGKRSLINRVIVNRPPVQVNFNYLLAGVRNEHRLGFITNYPDANDIPIYSEEICCFKNFTGQSTDFRNLFLAVSPDNDDINERITDNITPGELTPENLFVFGFGNCYINSYSMRAAVGQIPEASVGYVCDNVIGYNSGSGANIPAVYPKSGNIVDGVKFTIPHAQSIRDPSVIRPQDITFQITQNTNTILDENLFDYIYLWNIQTSNYNKIQLSGAISNENLLISSGISNPTTNFYSGLYLKNLTDGLYNKLLMTGATNNERMIIYSGIVSPPENDFEYIYLKNVTTNTYGKLNTFGVYSGENISIDNVLATGLYVTYPTDAYFGINSSGAPIQSFDISVQLDREELRSIGYVLPIDRRINFPIFVDINVSSIVDNNISGNLMSKLHNNEIYNLLINMYNPGCSPRNTRDIALQYKIQNAHLTKAEYSYNISNNLVANFGFQAEIDVDNPTKGMYISGLLNTTFPQDIYGFLLLENNQTGIFGTGFLLTDDTSDPLIIFDTQT